MCVDRKVLRDPEGPTGERVRFAFTVGSPPVFLSAWLVTYLSVRAPPTPPHLLSPSISARRRLAVSGSLVVILQDARLPLLARPAATTCPPRLVLRAALAALCRQSWQPSHSPS